MSRRLRLDAEEFELLEPHEVKRAGALMRFADPIATGDFVRRVTRDPNNLAVLRSLVTPWHPGGGASRPTDEEVRRGALALLNGRQLRVVRHGRRLVRVDGTMPTGEPMDGPAVEPAPKEDVSIDYRVIDDETGKPYQDVKLHITLADKSEQDKTTDADGMVDFPSTEPGSTEVTSEIESAELDQTFAFVGMGNRAPSDEEEEEELPPGPYQIRQVETHRVRTGETLESVAQAAGLSWQQLAKFNFGTSAPKEINKHLQYEIGCTKQDAAGDNFVFDGKDRPGTIFVPTKWTAAGLATERSHTFRVRRLERVLAIRLDDPFLGFLSEIDVLVTYADGSSESVSTDDSGVVEVKTDRFSDDGNYADLEFETELRKHELRMFLVLEHATSRRGAWQRLVNLGYVVLDEPKAEPENDDIFAAALEEFQADRGIRPTGELDGKTQTALDGWHLASRSWGEHGRTALDDPDDEDTRSKEAVA